MISTLKVLIGRDTVPYGNLALEKRLTLGVGAGECILFLWQNRKTVVIGRNQNPWEECRVRQLQEENGFLARRLSGGGAVFHDLGNLNFSFLVRKEAYDVPRQTEVILRAVRAMGIPAERDGRNDLTAEGRKFSGHAYYETRGCCCHHGTLMMDVRTEDLARYLTVNREKLQSRGVSSVRSRVVNLKTYCPEISRETLEEQLIRAFGETYGLPAEPYDPECLDRVALARDTAFLASPDWLFPRRLPMTAALASRFAWGGIRMELAVAQGQVREAVCWSDAMDEALIRQAAGALRGCPYEGPALAARILALSAEQQDLRQILADLAAMIREQVDPRQEEERKDRTGGSDANI